MSHLCDNGLSGESVGGLIGGDGTHSILFDMDGTRAAVRQRAIPSGENFPPANRHLERATAPGYKGRKRGERVRTRMTIQQRHTSEWLGTFSAPGNGDANAMLTEGCKAVVRYLTARGLPLRCGVVRADGEHGWLHRLEVAVEHGLGYLIRFCDYRALLDPAVRAALAHGAIARLRHADSGIERELFDLPIFHWSSNRVGALQMRLVVARHRALGAEPAAVGKRIHEWVYELVATSRSPQEWDAAQVYTLYQERGAFENVLAEEDREMSIDRWVSGNPHGQDLWQILCQWVWNLRVAAALRARSMRPQRELLDIDAEPFRGEPVELPGTFDRAAASTSSKKHRDEGERGPPCADENDPKPAPADQPHDAAGDVRAEGTADVPTQDAEEQRPDDDGDDGDDDDTGAAKVGRSHAASPEGFRYRDERTVVCPEGVLMRPIERAHTARGERIRFAAPGASCQSCEQSDACRGAKAKGTRRGRRVTMPLWSEVGTAPVQAGPRPAPRFHGTGTLLPSAMLPSSWERAWQATPIWQLVQETGRSRRWLLAHLRRHEVQIEVASLPPPTPHPPLRSHRAHRRRTWVERWQRNLLTEVACTITLMGLPAGLAPLLDGRPPPG